MAKARFHSVRGQKSALVAISPNAFQIGHSFVYLSRKGVAEALKLSLEDLESKGWDDELTFEIPDGYKLVPIVDENGEIRTSNDGSELKTLVW